MANRWLFAGGAPSTVRVVGGVSVQTSTIYFDSTYADHAIQAFDTPNKIYADFVDASGSSDFAASGETVWFRASIYFFSWGQVGTMMQFVNGSDQPWLAVRSTSTQGTYGFYYNSGTGASPVWTLIGSTFSLANGLHVFDMNLTIGSPHSAALYVDGTERATGSFTQASLTEIHAGMLAPYYDNNFFFSEILASVGYPTVGSHVFYGKPNGAGSNSAWTGAYTAIDETAADDGDSIVSTTTGQRSTFAYDNLPTLSPGFAIGDVFMWTRAKADGTAPTNVKPVKRTGGVDSVGSQFSGMGAGWGEFLTRYSGMSESDYNAAEFGVESAA